MVIYSEQLYPDGPCVTFKVRWANQPLILAQGEGINALRLVGVRLAGDRLEVGIGTPEGVEWTAVGNVLDEYDAMRWARQGFGRR